MIIYVSATAKPYEPASSGITNGSWKSGFEYDMMALVYTGVGMCVVLILWVWGGVATSRMFTRTTYTVVGEAKQERPF